jgi:hypothetical protein
MTGSRAPPEGVVTADWWLRDVAVCALCGAKMASAYAGPKGEGRRHYFRCRAKCKGSHYTPVHQAEGAFELSVWDRLTALREELSAPAVIKPAAKVVDLAARRAKLEARRAKAIELCVNGITTQDELRGQLDRLDQERLRLDAIDVPVDPPPSRDALKEQARIAGQIAQLWIGLLEQPRTRRQIVNRLAVSVGLAIGKDPKPVWRPAVEVNLSEVADLLTKGADPSGQRGVWPN